MTSLFVQGWKQVQRGSNSESNGSEIERNSKIKPVMSGLINNISLISKTLVPHTLE